MPESYQPPINWNEEMTRLFLDFGRYFVPEREEQFRLLADLVPTGPGAFHVLELGSGDGQLARTILAKHPQACLHLLDGSPGMLLRAARSLEEYPGRFTTGHFSLAASDWRAFSSPAHALPEPARAIVTSMTVHHLDGPGKAVLFRDLLGLLAPGGALLLADIVLPAGPEGTAAAAARLDEVVKAQSQAAGDGLRAWEVFQKEGWNIFRVPDEMDKPSPLVDQLEWLRQAGFDAVDVFWMKAGHAIYGGRKP